MLQGHRHAISPTNGLRISDRVAINAECTLSRIGIDKLFQLSQVLITHICLAERMRAWTSADAFGPEGVRLRRLLPWAYRTEEDEASGCSCKNPGWPHFWPAVIHLQRDARGEVFR